MSILIVAELSLEQLHLLTGQCLNGVLVVREGQRSIPREVLRNDILRIDCQVDTHILCLAGIDHHRFIARRHGQTGAQQQVATTVDIELGRNGNALFQETEVETHVERLVGLPLQVFIRNDTRSITRHQSIAHGSKHGTEQCQTVIAAYAVVSCQTVTDAELQVGEDIELLDEFLLTQTPGGRYGRENAPLVVGTELGRAVGTQSSTQQVLVLIVIVDTGEEREQVIIIVQIRIRRRRCTDTHVIQLEVIGRQITNLGVNITFPTVHILLPQLGGQLVRFLETGFVSQHVRGLKTAIFRITDRAISTVTASHDGLVAIKQLATLRTVTHTGVVAESQPLHYLVGQSAISL